MYNTYLTNDMANARLRGSAVAATQNGSAYTISNANWDAMFDGTATFFNISPTSGFTFPLVITVPLPRTLTYGTWVGLSFGSTTFRANSVTIEVFSLDSNSWVTVFTTTSNTSEDIFTSVSGLTNSNATGINQVRYTIAAPNSTQLRLQHLWAYNFNSDMWSQTMMPRAGGSFYGPISPPSITTTGGINATGNWSNSFGGSSISNSIVAIRPAQSNIGLIVRGASGQSGNLTEWQNDTPVTLASVSSTGRGSFDTLNAPNGAFFGNLTSQPGGGAYLAVQGFAAGHRPLLVRGFGATTANLVDYQDGSSVILGGRNGVGQIFTGSTTPILTATGGTIQSIASGANPLVTMASAHGFTTGDLVTLAGTTGGTYNGTFSVASTPASTTFTITSALTAGQAGTGGTASDPAQLSVTARSAGTIGQVIRGATSQAVDLLQTQTSGGTVNFGVDSIGSVFTAALMGMDRSNAILLSSSRNVGLNAGSANYGGGAAVTFIGNAATAPTTSPTGGGILFVNAGALTYRGTSGGNTTVVNADGSVSLSNPLLTSISTVGGGGSEGGQINFARVTDGAQYWFIDSFGTSGTPDLRFVENATERFRLVSGGAISLGGQTGASGQLLASAGGSSSPTWRNGPVDATTTTATTGFGYMGLPQNATTTGSYTIVAADAGRHIYASATRTVTINSNANLALPIGTTITFIAGTGATMTIAITTDTLILAGPGTTGSRTLAPFGMATAVKITSTSWIISGNGLT
jgi:hypothetical protein